jgi:hypothetical protein
MDHLFNSVVRVEELQLTQEDGELPEMNWVQATHDDPALNAMLLYLRCRIDMNFVRPGKDILPAPEAGKAPDRVGVLFTYNYAPIKAGQRLVAIENDWGIIPVPGNFEIRYIPDVAIDYSSPHHIEVQVIETAQKLTTANWPTEEPTPGDEEFPEEPEAPEPPEEPTP